MPNCDNCTNIVDIKTDIGAMKSDLRHIAEMLNKDEADKQRQWDKIDEHSTVIATLDERTKNTQKYAVGGGAASGGLLVAIVEGIKLLLKMG